jgi:hypothetical protein
MRALVVMPEPMHRILDGHKCWEIRRGRCHIRELIGLIESGSGRVVGVAELIGCEGPLTRAMRIKNYRKMGVSLEEAAEPWPRGLYAWVLRNRSRLKTPVPYQHPSGIVRWVPLTNRVAAKIREQLNASAHVRSFTIASDRATGSNGSADSRRRV